MIKIQIIGRQGEGKTTFASEIGALLQSLGMDVTIDDFDLDDGPRDSELHQQCVEAMSGEEVLIQTVQVRK